MLKLRKIAVTGSISSGKSLVLNFFKEFGAIVVDADEIVHNILTTETKLGQKVINLLGKDVVVEDRIDKSKIAKKVFNNEKLLKALEKLVHPLVYDEIEKRYEDAKKKAATTLFIAEVPLLFESGGERFFDRTVVVAANVKLCLKRYYHTTKKDKEEFWRRTSFQMPQEEKVKKADFVIYNNSTKEELKKNVQTLIETISREQ